MFVKSQYETATAAPNQTNAQNRSEARISGQDLELAAVPRYPESRDSMNLPEQ